jgi:hypothetical protein
MNFALNKAKDGLGKDDLFAVNNLEASRVAERKNPSKESRAWGAGALEKYLMNLAKTDALEAKKKAVSYGAVAVNLESADRLYSQAYALENKSFTAAAKLFQDAKREYDFHTTLAISAGKKPKSDEELLASR